MRIQSSAAVAIILCSTSLFAQESGKAAEKKSKPVVVELKGTDFTMVAPEDWESKKPKFPQIINYEFAVPAKAKEGEPTAKITISRAGGGVAANIARWESQMEKLDKEKSKVSELEIAGQKVTMVDLYGSFKDTMGAPPMARVKPKIRENYRMLGAVIETKQGGLHFVKAIGPDEIIEKLADPLKKMVKEMKSKK